MSGNARQRRKVRRREARAARFDRVMVTLVRGMIEDGRYDLFRAFPYKPARSLAIVFVGILLASQAHAQSSHLTRVQRSLAFGLNLNIRSPDKPYRYNRPLPKPDQLPPSDVVLYPEGAIATRNVYARDRGQPGWLHVGATGRSVLEETHPSDLPPKYGPSYDTPRHAVLGGIVAESWSRDRWVEQSRLVFTDRGLYFVSEGGVVPVVEIVP